MPNFNASSMDRCCRREDHVEISRTSHRTVVVFLAGALLATASAAFAKYREEWLSDKQVSASEGVKSARPQQVARQEHFVVSARVKPAAKKRAGNIAPTVETTDPLGELLRKQEFQAQRNAPHRHNGKPATHAR